MAITDWQDYRVAAIWPADLMRANYGREWPRWIDRQERHRQIAGMPRIDIFYLQDNFFWICAAAAACIAVAAAYADKRRQSRKEIEAVGFMPWTTITVLAGISCFISLLYAIALMQG